VFDSPAILPREEIGMSARRSWLGRLVLILAACVACASGAGAGVFDFTAEPESLDTYTTARFRLYVPDTIAVSRGTYFYLDPYNCDSRYIASDEQFRALCGQVHFSLMGAQLDNVRMESGIGTAVLRALTAFADSSGHAEIEGGALFLDGWSWGGQFAYHFMRWKPERVIGFITEKGGYHDSTVAAIGMEVPGYLFIGELDLPYRITNLTGIFEHHRPLGARWILAMQPGAAHERITDRELLDPFFLTAARLRLPEEIIPGEPVILREIPEDAGWLGNRETLAIGAFACYHAPVGEACWFAERPIGEGWQDFVSSGTVGDTIPCGPAAIGEPPMDRAEVLALRLASPGRLSAPLAFWIHLPEGGRAELALFDLAGRRLRVLDLGHLPGGDRRLSWDAASGLGRGVYFARLRCGDRSATRPIILSRD
jgi:hypothetical protein